jgi:serine phosphatase RsbU (regulator of sigma subunit)
LGELRVASALLESLRALGTGKVLDEVLALVLDSAIEISGAERGFIMLAGATQDLEFMLGRRRGQVTLDRSQFDDRSQKVPSEAFAKSETLFVRDIASPGGGHDRSQLLGIRSVVAVPLRQMAYQEGRRLKGTERPIGVLYLDSHGHGMLEAAQTVGALEALGAQAAVTLENAQLYRQAVQKARMEHELRLAAEIQQGLLPKGVVAGTWFSAAARSVPCREIGGDFYDHARLADEVFSFALGDVAGKGSPAALLSALVQGILTAQHATVISIADAVAHVNEALVRRELDGKFVTLFYGRITPDGRLSYCNAGHNPPLLVGRGGIRRLETGGPVVGLFPEMAFEDDVVQLMPGDQLIVYSDGLPDAENSAGEEMGEEALESAIRASASLDPQRQLDALFDHVAAFSGEAAQNDDRTALVLRYIGAGA